MSDHAADLTERPTGALVITLVERDIPESEVEAFKERIEHALGGVPVIVLAGVSAAVWVPGVQAAPE